MRFPQHASKQTALQAASERTYDVVIVGAGVSGAIIAHQLSAAGKHVLIVDAGPGEDITLKGYESYVHRFYGTATKDNQSPFPRNPNAPMPRSIDIQASVAGKPEAGGYLVQNGPYLTDTTYTRVLGGTSMHLEAKTPRMIPEDFAMKTRYGCGPDWPLNYEELEPYYRAAEREIGVSADVEAQRYHGLSFPNDYVYPMRGLPLSYLDRMVDAGIKGTDVVLDGERYPLNVRPYPQGRNGIPNPKYDGGQGYVPVGAVSTHQVEEGQRCQGNTNCVPICPVQAKYHAGKTLAKALQSGRVELLTQAVASKVEINPDNGKVQAIEVKRYHEPDNPAYETAKIKGRLFVLSAGAIETARLMLASNLSSTNKSAGAR
ncbi:MAG: GMC family oxidoreductase, partial [Myxococcota bacterium]